MSGLGQARHHRHYLCRDRRLVYKTPTPAARGDGRSRDRIRQDWHTYATGLIQALEGLGAFLNNAAETIESVDSQLAQGLNS